MLAFHLPIEVAYDLSSTAASYAIAVVVSGFALLIFRRNDTTVSGIALPGVFMGLGITRDALHGHGRDADGARHPLRARAVRASVLIAIGASIAALTDRLQPAAGTQRSGTGTRSSAASVMGAAIVGMHYTGMAAANCSPPRCVLHHERAATRLDLARDDHRRVHVPDPRVRRCSCPSSTRSSSRPSRAAAASCAPRTKRSSSASSIARCILTRERARSAGDSAPICTLPKGAGRGGQSRQERVPRDDQPRDPHAHERDPRPARAARASRRWTTSSARP